jgi:hypothetical protein
MMGNRVDAGENIVVAGGRPSGFSDRLRSSTAIKMGPEDDANRRSEEKPAAAPRAKLVKAPADLAFRLTI